MMRFAPPLACLACALAVSPTIAQKPAAEPIPEVKTIAFDSAAVGRTLKYNISLPVDYDKSGDKRYPVLYLLHGLTSNYTDWAKLGAPKAARGLDLIVVMADGGNSWYVNWAESEDGQKNAWEDCIIQDLIGHVDANYRTIARREGRAINGLSMGGFGGIMLGLRHPDMFCSIGSQSGALTIPRMMADALNGKNSGILAFLKRSTNDNGNPEIGLEHFDSPAERTPNGTMFAKVEHAADHDPFQLVLKVPKKDLPHIYVDCGTEDFLIGGCREFARLLAEHNIPHVYAESTGGHSPQYWSREIYTAVAVQYSILQRNLARAAGERP
ncbi:MAG: alpha/beta hydrolase family protein [Isosphaeraceae bacterium]